MLSDAQAIVDGAIAGPGIKARRGPHLRCRHPGRSLGGLRGIARLADEGAPNPVGLHVATGADVCLILKAFIDDDVGQGVDDRHIGARLQLQVVVGPHMRGLNQVDGPGIHDDQASALAQPPLHDGGKHRMGLGGVGADDHDDIGLQHRIKVLGASGLTQGGFQSVARGRVADSRAGVHVVVARCGADELLHHINLFVGAARRGDPADGLAPVARLNPLQALRGGADGFIPTHRTPFVVDAVAHQGRRDAVPVGGVAKGEPPLHAGVAVIGVAVAVRHHAHELAALGLRTEGAAHPAVRASGDDRALRLAVFDDRLFNQRGRGAGLDAGAARHALGVDEGVVLAGDDLGVEAAPADGQGVGALLLLAGAHAAGADDALGRVEAEIQGGVVLGLIQMMGAVVAVAHGPQAHRAGHVLKFAIAVGGAGQAIQGMVGDVEFHDVAPQLRQPGRLGMHHHAFLDQGGAGRRIPLAPLNGHHAQAAGAKGGQVLGGAKLGHTRPDQGRGTHHRGAFGHANGAPVDFDVDRCCGGCAADGSRRA